MAILDGEMLVKELACNQLVHNYKWALFLCSAKSLFHYSSDFFYQQQTKLVITNLGCSKELLGL